MDRFQHCTVEWYWTAPVGMEATFTPHFRIFAPDGSSTAHPGQSGEVTNALTRLGAEGYEVVACIGVANWILWTLKRRHYG